MDFTVNLLVSSVIRTTHPLAMCPPNPFTEVLLVNPGYWGAYPRVLRVLTVHQKLEPNRGMNFLRTRETFCLSNLKKNSSKMVSFSVYRKNSVTRISFFRWMSETFERWFHAFGKKRSQVFCYAGEMRHVATWPSTCMCHATLSQMTRHDSSCDGSQVSSSANFGGSLVWCSGVLLQVRHRSFIPLQRFQHVENCKKTSTEGLDTSLGPQWRKHFLAEETIKQNKAVGKVRWHLILHGTFTYVSFYRRRRLWLKNVGYQNKLQNW